MKAVNYHPKRGKLHKTAASSLGATRQMHRSDLEPTLILGPRVDKRKKTAMANRWLKQVNCQRTPPTEIVTVRRNALVGIFNINVETRSSPRAVVLH